MNNNDFHLDLAPAIIVIFGVTGDLSIRKLLPSLYELEKNSLLHDKTRIVGITRRKFRTADLLEQAKPGIRAKDGRVDNAVLKRLHKKFTLYMMNMAENESYPELHDYLDDIEDKAGICMNRLLYLAIPPQISMPIITYLGENGLTVGCRTHHTLSHLLLEKPFGFDVATAEELIETTRRYFQEKQLYRIDHYLAKETVQNLVAFRFRNPIFEDIWDNRHIKSITIVADEKLDIEGRADFYEQTGALRDIIQSHLLYVMSVIMMDRPRDIASGDAIHTERQKILDSIEPIPVDKLAKRALRGQYEGYKTEAASPYSYVETFAALKLFSRDERWRNVPIILRTGKALDDKRTCIIIEFKSKTSDHGHTNRLAFYLQPNESIVVELWVKKPGFKRELQIAPMQFNYRQIFDAHGHPDAYERVLVDAIRGDNALFATSDEVMSAWRILEPVLTTWSADGDGLVSYKKGSAGPNLELLMAESPSE